MVNNLQVQALLDNRQMEFGELHGKKEELGNGLTYWGIFSGKKIYTFDDWYLDPATNKLEPYIPADMALFGTSEAETDIAYGSLSALVNGMPTVIEAKQLTAQKSDADLVAINNQVKSAKLYCLTQAGAFCAVKATF